MPRTAERRQHPRYPVYMGRAELVAIVGRGGETRPGVAARLVDWGRGGVLLRLDHPARRLLVWRRPAPLYADDAVALALRLPPRYAPIEVIGEAVRVERESRRSVLVAVRFDAERTLPGRLKTLAGLLEPRARSGRIRKADRASRRLVRAAS